jgi:uncharacterized membrane protein
MEKYRARIKKRLVVMSITILVVVAMYLVFSLYRGSLPPIPDFIKGFHAGAFVGVAFMLMFLVGKYFMCLRKEESLRKLYIEENDERTKMIMQKSGAIGMVICMIGLAIATIVAGFLDKTVFLSLLGALLFISLVRGFIKIYYHLNM